MSEIKTSLETALQLIVLSPHISSLLIDGPMGCGKSYRTRQYLKEWGVPYIEIPASVSEETLRSHFDIQKSLHEGKVIYEDTVLERAAQKIIYVDNINLMDPHTLRLLFHLQKEQEAKRKGFSIVGTMNSREAVLDDSLLRQFHGFVELENPNFDKRVALLKSIRTGKINSTVLEIKEKIVFNNGVKANFEESNSMLQLATMYCLQAGVCGNELEFILWEAVKVIATLANRNFALPSDFDMAAMYILPHQMHTHKSEEAQDNKAQDGEHNEPPEAQESESTTNLSEMSEPMEMENGLETTDEGKSNLELSSNSSSSLNEQLADINRQLFALSLAMNGNKDRFKRSGMGKRWKTRSSTSRGHFVRAIPYTGKNQDLALESTIRAAAPYQKLRDKGPLAIKIEKSDWQIKERETKIGRHILFVVDASGSMGAKKRMEAVKGAIYSLLTEAYVKRDSVGVIAFRKQSAEILLPFTHSIELAKKKLEELPTGGRTPLASSLELTYEMLQSLFRRNSYAKPLVILVTDGRATAGESPIEDSYKWADVLRDMKTVEFIVIDTENDFITLGIAKELSKHLGSAYYALKDINTHAVIETVNKWS